MRIVYVDGYNVINSWPNLKKRKEYSYEAARKKLIDTLENYASFNHYKIEIVFDAHKVAGNLEKKEIIGDVTVVFTKDGETADAYIERSVHEVGKKIEVIVVTSDNLEQQTIFQRGAIRMSSLEFYHEVIKVEKIIEKKSQKQVVTCKNFLSDSLERDIFEKLDKLRKS